MAGKPKYKLVRRFEGSAPVKAPTRVQMLDNYGPYKKDQILYIAEQGRDWYILKAQEKAKPGKMYVPMAVTSTRIKEKRVEEEDEDNIPSYNAF